MLKSMDAMQKVNDLRAAIKAKTEAKEEVTPEEIAGLQAAWDEYNKAMEDEASAKFKSKEGKNKMDRKLFNKALKKFIINPKDSEALKMIDAATGNNGSVAEDGGVLIPEEFLDLVENNVNTVDLRPLVTPITVGTRAGRVPIIDYSQKIELVDFEENNAIQKAKAVFSSAKFSLASKGSIIPISRELVWDSKTDVVSVVAKLFGIVYVKSVASAIVAKAIAGTNSAKSTVTALNTVSGLDAIRAAIQKLPLGAKSNASIIINQSTWADMANTKDKQDRYLLGRDANNDTIEMIGGRPVIVVEDDTLANDTVVVGNFKAIYHIAYPELEVLSDEHAGFDTNSVEVRAIARFDDLNTFDKAFAVITKGA